MDILHHTAIGAAGAMALATAGEPLAASAFLVASILPDADVAYMAKGKRAFLRAHQTMTHSLLVGAGLSVIIGVTGAFHFGAVAGLAAGAAFFAGLLIHVLLDASNTLGTHLLWPFGRRVRLDAAFFIDATSWSLTGAVFLALWLTGAAWPFAAYLVVMASQILLRARIAARSKTTSGYPVAIPDPLLPWVFHLTRIEKDGSTSTARWSAFSGISREGHTSPPTSEALKISGASAAVSDMSGFARALAIVEETESASGEQKIVLRDVSMRRLGGRYGEVTLTKFANGEIDEQINI